MQGEGTGFVLMNYLGLSEGSPRTLGFNRCFLKSLALRLRVNRLNQRFPKQTTLAKATFPRVFSHLLVTTAFASQLDKPPPPLCYFQPAAYSRC